MQDKVEIVKAWMTKGDHDLGTAKLTHAHIPEYKDTICFHCQQAIEKYLKAYLVHLEIEFKFVHDLICLLDLIKQKDPFGEEFYEMASSIEDFAVQIRYPDSTIEPEEHEVQAAIEFVEKFRRTVEQKMNLPGLV